MINRSNWLLVKSYLLYRNEVDLLATESVQLEERYLTHLLEWADTNSFESVEQIRPSFPVYLLSARRDGYQNQLSAAYVKKITSAARRFFGWIKLHRRGFYSISEIWIASLKVPRMESGPVIREAVTINQVRDLAAAPVEHIREMRIQAAAIFWFLSGIRIGAFVTLPIKSVDLIDHSVKQWPSLGVRTKFTKHQTTFLLNIPDLLEVVKHWDSLVRNRLQDSSSWFAPLCPKNGDLAGSPI